MLRQAFINAIGTTPKVAVIVITLIANAIAWYFYIFNFLMNIIQNAGFSNSEVMMIWGINFLGIAIFAVLSASFIYRFRHRVTFLFYWMLLGVLISLMPMAFDISKLYIITLFCLLIGAYFGLGVPICFGYFASATNEGNRSRLSGIAFLSVFLGFFLLTRIEISNVLLNSIILAAWKATGLIILIFLKPEEKPISQSDKISYSFIFKNRSFFLYFIPWLMFSVVNSLAVPIISDFFTENFMDYNVASSIEMVLAAIMAVVFGFIGDNMGRKRLTLIGFVLLGLGYASLGLFPSAPLGYWFYIIADGVAWGAFYTIFLITLWGDLAEGKSSENYYAFGSLPYLLSNFLRISAGAVVGNAVPESAVFSFASLFLFVAVLPLIYAPETLPERIMKERELKTYIEKAQKAKEKYS
ncbi:MAG: hypothetical protein NWE99_03825 [Candidatus Bathyarchaeota archaeon]|nr:hypothetical protein [Candidatus Bathyarchaeota archaeon]